MARRRSSRCIPRIVTRAGSEARERYAPSLVSSVPAGDTIEAIRRLIRHVNSSLPGKAVAGYHIAGLNDGQFFQWARHDPKDSTWPTQRGLAPAFRDWLRCLPERPGRFPPPGAARRDVRDGGDPRASAAASGFFLTLRATRISRTTTGSTARERWRRSTPMRVVRRKPRAGRS